jgi:hypothetical protein
MGNPVCLDSFILDTNTQTAVSSSISILGAVDIVSLAERERAGPVLISNCITNFKHKIGPRILGHCTVM